MTVAILSRQDHQTEQLWCKYGEQQEQKYRQNNLCLIQISYLAGSKLIS